MANSDRKIHRGVRVSGKGGKTYVPGMEDELDAQLSAEEVERLSRKGYIEGKWSGVASSATPATTETESPKPSTATPAKKEK